MFLLFGGSRAVLFETGATANPEFFPLRRTQDTIIETGWPPIRVPMTTACWCCISIQMATAGSRRAVPRPAGAPR